MGLKLLGHHQARERSCVIIVLHMFFLLTRVAQLVSAGDQLGPNVKLEWIILVVPQPDVLVEPLLLNCMEMGSAALLQTFPKRLLNHYLPGEALLQLAGCHLNVASPLSHGQAPEQEVG